MTLNTHLLMGEKVRLLREDTLYWVLEFPVFSLRVSKYVVSETNNCILHIETETFALWSQNLRLILLILLKSVSNF